MRILVLVLVAALAVSACGKKAPLRAPSEDPDRQEQLR